MWTPAQANVMRWQHQPGRYEVWYATFSHLATRTGFWIRYTLEAPVEGHGDPYAQLWFGRFDPARPERTFAFNRKFLVSVLQSRAVPFRIKIGDAELRQDGMTGALSGDGHEVQWDLSWSEAKAVHLHLPNLVYKLGFAETEVLSPNLHVPVKGRVTVDGELYEFAGDPLGQTHIWGRKHAYSWAWSHCNTFVGAPETCLETLSIRLRRRGRILPTLTLVSIYLDGVDAKTPPIEFRQFWQLPLARSEYGGQGYRLHAANATHKIEIDYSCRPEDMLIAEYADPDGEASFCHNTECATAKLSIYQRSLPWQRFDKVRELFAHRTAHFEWGARTPDPSVSKRHLAL